MVSFWLCIPFITMKWVDWLHALAHTQIYPRIHYPRKVTLKPTNCNHSHPAKQPLPPGAHHLHPAGPRPNNPHQATPCCGHWAVPHTPIV
jgi:hypothetical protein